MSLRDFALLMLVCVIWGVNNLVSKFVVGHLGVPPMFYAAARCAVVALIALPWLLPMPRPRWRLLAVALLMGAGNFALLFVGLQTSSPSSAVIVLQVGVPMTTVLSVIMLGEQIHWRRGLGIALTLAGVITVMWDPKGFVLSTGLLFVVASAACSALGSVLMKKLGDVKPMQYQAWLAFASLWPLAALTILTEPGQVSVAWQAGWPFAAALAYVCIVVSFVAHNLYFVIIRRNEANMVSALGLMMPLVTIGLGVTLMGDPFGPRMAIGSAVALAGVLMIVVRRNQVTNLLAVRNSAE